MTTDGIIQMLIGALGFLAVYTLRGIQKDIQELSNAIRASNDRHESLERRVLTLEINCENRNPK